MMLCIRALLQTTDVPGSDAFQELLCGSQSVMQPVVGETVSLRVYC